jgi:hypothetical protein
LPACPKFETFIQTTPKRLPSLKPSPSPLLIVLDHTSLASSVFPLTTGKPPCHPQSHSHSPKPNAFTFPLFHYRLRRQQPSSAPVPGASQRHRAFQRCRPHRPLPGHLGHHRQRSHSRRETGFRRPRHCYCRRLSRVGCRTNLDSRNRGLICYMYEHLIVQVHVITKTNQSITPPAPPAAHAPAD